MKAQLHLIVFIAALPLVGCGTSPHGGPTGLYLLSPAVNSVGLHAEIEGDDGSSQQTALKVRHAGKDMVDWLERSWIYKHRWLRQTPRPEDMGFSSSDAEFCNSLHFSTRRVGKKVYDVAELTLRSGEKQKVYFDVTGYKKVD